MPIVDTPSWSVYIRFFLPSWRMSCRVRGSRSSAITRMPPFWFDESVLESAGNREARTAFRRAQTLGQDVLRDLHLLDDFPMLGRRLGAIGRRPAVLDR